jgi:hypothetical protein
MISKQFIFQSKPVATNCASSKSNVREIFAKLRGFCPTPQLARNLSAGRQRLRDLE